jgi:hypothetical protein
MFTGLLLLLLLLLRQALNDEFKCYLPELIPQMLHVLHTDRSLERFPTQKVCLWLFDECCATRRHFVPLDLEGAGSVWGEVEEFVFLMLRFFVGFIHCFTVLMTICISLCRLWFD